MLISNVVNIFAQMMLLLTIKHFNIRVLYVYSVCEYITVLAILSYLSLLKSIRAFYCAINTTRMLVKCSVK